MAACELDLEVGTIVIMIQEKRVTFGDPCSKLDNMRKSTSIWLHMHFKLSKNNRNPSIMAPGGHDTDRKYSSYVEDKS